MLTKNASYYCETTYGLPLLNVKGESLVYFCECASLITDLITISRFDGIYENSAYLPQLLVSL